VSKGVTVVGMTPTSDIRKAANKVAAAKRNLEAAVKAGSAAGLSLRKIAAVADVSHMQVSRILAGETTKPSEKPAEKPAETNLADLFRKAS
jgi:hypothetical protein